MEKEVKFSLVFRDMWQSAGKYVPRVDQLVKVAQPLSKWGVSLVLKQTGAVLNKLTCFLEKTRIEPYVSGQSRSTKREFKRICWTVP